MQSPDRRPGPGRRVLTRAMTLALLGAGACVGLAAAAEVVGASGASDAAMLAATGAAAVGVGTGLLATSRHDSVSPDPYEPQEARS